MELPTPHLRALVIDDDEGVRRMLETALPRHGHSVYLAAGGDEAVEVYRLHGQSIDVVLLDVHMPPGMDGPHTLAALRQLNPDVRCCFMSGGHSNYSRDDLLALGAADFFDKPFRDLGQLALVLLQVAENREN